MKTPKCKICEFGATHLNHTEKQLLGYHDFQAEEGQTHGTPLEQQKQTGKFATVQEKSACPDSSAYYNITICKKCKEQFDDYFKAIEHTRNCFPKKHEGVMLTEYRRRIIPMPKDDTTLKPIGAKGKALQEGEDTTTPEVLTPLLSSGKQDKQKLVLVRKCPLCKRIIHILDTETIMEKEEHELEIIKLQERIADLIHFEFKIKNYKSAIDTVLKCRNKFPCSKGYYCWACESRKKIEKEFEEFEIKCNPQP